MSRILCGDALETLRTLDAESVQCVVTSPPYWGLRDYGIEGQLGLERTPEEYAARMVEVFREVRRVLREDGTLWLNLGDSYAGSWGAQSRGGPPSESSTLRGNGHVGGGPKVHELSRIQVEAAPKTTHTGSVDKTPGLKPKDLVGIPWRLAFALQADGWYLRSDIIWHKPNPMPESVTDRPTKAHEYLFLLAKSQRYYYDAEAIAEPAMLEHAARYNTPFTGSNPELVKPGGTRTHPKGMCEWKGTRNSRTVWTITTAPFSGAHFATFPEALVEPCIRAGTKPGDVVLDPFMGAGTVGLVAVKLGREYLGIELNPKYVEMAERRIRGEVGLFAGGTA